MIDTGDYQIFQDIVGSQDISPKISAFFENLKSSTVNGSATDTITVLNGIFTESSANKTGSGEDSGEKDNGKKAAATDWIAWFELLFNIYIVKWHKAERATEPVKSPVFCTFSRTFEHPAFYPEYWFELSQEKKRPKDLISSPAELLPAFDRYMYDRDGGACWSALDLNIDKFIFRCVCEPAGKAGNDEDPCEKIASMILTVHRIVTGRMCLYISESQDVNLKYAGVKTGDPALLKYFHYDRYTRYSCIKKHELDKDADKTNPFPAFSSRWSAHAAMTEFVLLSKGARATRMTSSRVSTGAVLKSLSKLLAENSLQNNQRALAMLDAGIELLDSDNFAEMSTAEVLAAIDWEYKLLPADHYLKKYEIRNAETFWAIANKVFGNFIEQFNDRYYALLSNVHSAEKFKGSSVSLSDDSSRLLQCLKWDRMEELYGRLSGARMREALKTLLINGDLEFHGMQLWAILQKNYNREPLQFFNPQNGRKIPLLLTYQALCSDLPAKNVPAELNAWAREILSASTKDRNNEVVLNFAAVDFSAIQEASDKTWDVYFDPGYESAVKSRYIISLLRAKEILESSKDRYAGIKLVTGAARQELLRYLDEELYSMLGAMEKDLEIELDIETEKKAFISQNVYCFADFGPTWQRVIVILDIIARLVVTTAKSEVFAAIWNNIDERIRFITHILSATHSNLEHPFPYHIGLQGDTVLRISRGTDQRDHLSRLANHEYESLAEQYCFLMSLGKYLQMESTPVKILQTIMDNPALAAFAAPEQLDHLKTYFLAGER